MMRIVQYIALWWLALLGWMATGCTQLSEGVYEESLLELQVSVSYPEGFESYCREGVRVEAEEIYSANRYATLTDSQGGCTFRLERGFYRISVADRTEEAIFNGLTDRVRLTEESLRIEVPLSYSKPGTLIIREIYSGGCSKAPYEGYYQADRYFIIHNNNNQTEYLDGLCFGTLDPYNANSPSGNVWTTTDPDTGTTLFREYAPVVEALWQISGTGSDFALEPGEGAVVAINGAIDHTQQYPESVNLNCQEYFVCYNPTLYPNVTYHPTPGDQILASHHCEVLLKVGQSNGYVISSGSPTLIIIRPPAEVDIRAYLADRTQSTITKPGSSELCIKVPWEWVLDGVEVFNGTAANNVKRLPDPIDAGFVYLSGSAMSHTVHRRLDDQATQAAGYDIYLDTNNSSTDLYEREEQSLKAYE